MSAVPVTEQSARRDFIKQMVRGKFSKRKPNTAPMLGVKTGKGNPIQLSPTLRPTATQEPDGSFR